MHRGTSRRSFLERGEGCQILGDDLAAQRAALRLSLRDLARRSGLSHNYIRLLERGERLPSRDVMEALSVALRISFVISNGQTTIEGVTRVLGG
jgi:transcriptional regulator with XRE-family HTH domain